jgi:hypothetical protein
MGLLDKSAKTSKVQDILEKHFESKIWDIPDFDYTDKKRSSHPQWLGVACEIVFYFSVLAHVRPKEYSPLEVIKNAYQFEDEEIKLCKKDVKLLVQKAWEHAAWRIPHASSDKAPPFDSDDMLYLEKKFTWFKKVNTGVTKCDPRFHKLGGDAILCKKNEWEIVEIKNDTCSKRKKTWINQALLLFLKKYYESVFKVDIAAFNEFLPWPDFLGKSPKPIKNREAKLEKHCISEKAKVSIVCPMAEKVFSFYPLKHLRRVSKGCAFADAIKDCRDYF